MDLIERLNKEIPFFPRSSDSETVRAGAIEILNRLDAANDIGVEGVEAIASALSTAAGEMGSQTIPRVAKAICAKSVMMIFNKYKGLKSFKDITAEFTEAAWATPSSMEASAWVFSNDEVYATIKSLEQKGFSTNIGKTLARIACRFDYNVISKAVSVLSDIPQHESEKLATVLYECSAVWNRSAMIGICETAVAYSGSEARKKIFGIISDFIKSNDSQLVESAVSACNEPHIQAIASFYSSEQLVELIKSIGTVHMESRKNNHFCQIFGAENIQKLISLYQIEAIGPLAEAITTNQVSNLYLRKMVIAFCIDGAKKLAKSAKGSQLLFYYQKIADIATDSHIDDIEKNVKLYVSKVSGSNGSYRV